MASAPTLADATSRLAGTAYGARIDVRQGLAEARRAVAETALWHIRVIAGWVPPHGLEAIRALAAWFELANVGARLAYLRGGSLEPPYALGGLGSAGPAIAAAQSVDDVRSALRASPWGDPGTSDPDRMMLALELAWSARVLADVAEAELWAAGAGALVVARELLLAGRPIGDTDGSRPRGLGLDWPSARDLDALRLALPARAAWVLADISDPSELWKAETGWVDRVRADAERMARAELLGRPAVIGSVVLIGLDAWRVGAALEVAARGGRGPALEVFERLV